MHFDFENKIIVVTGALGAIGSAIVKRFLESGATVVITDMKEDSTDYLDGIYILYKGKYCYHQCDITLREHCSKLFDFVIKMYGRVDVLVNNAGMNSAAEFRTTIDNYNDDEWQRIININLVGVFNCSKAALKYMSCAGKGRIVNIGSVVGKVPLRMQSAYGAAKAGVHNLTQSMAIELAEKGIYVNAIIPGSIRNQYTSKLFYQDAEKNESFMSHIPLHRPGEPEEIASAVAFLSDDEASYITGQILAVDGGWSCGYARNW